MRGRRKLAVELQAIINFISVDTITKVFILIKMINILAF
jgi:hypothetical protein